LELWVFSGIESSGDATIEGLTMCLFSWLAVLKLELRFQLPKTWVNQRFISVATKRKIDYPAKI
jgi:hypothetical protein